jgi:hypothetical protein
MVLPILQHRIAKLKEGQYIFYIGSTIFAVVNVLDHLEQFTASS